MAFRSFCVPFFFLLLQKENPIQDITIRGMGRAISKAVTVAEIVKRRIVGLHQITSIDRVEINDVYEPTEEGLRTSALFVLVMSVVIVLDFSTAVW